MWGLLRMRFTGSATLKEPRNAIKMTYQPLIRDYFNVLTAHFTWLNVGIPGVT